MRTCILIAADMLCMAINPEFKLPDDQSRVVFCIFLIGMVFDVIDIFK